MAVSLSLFSANRNRILILFVIAMIGAQACILHKESPFFAKFSMANLVAANKSMTGSACDPAGGGGGGGGGGSIFSSGGGLGRGGMHFQSHKSDSFACRLQSGTLATADEEQLIASLRKQVEDSLRTYGANISESGGRDSHSFYFTYAIKDIQGRIQVSGQRIGADFYNLQATLEESK